MVRLLQRAEYGGECGVESWSPVTEGEKKALVSVHSELFSAMRRMMLCRVEENMHFVTSVSERRLSHIFSHCEF